MSGIELIGWIGTACQMLGLLLNAHKKTACWPIWLTSNAFLITYSIVLSLWPVLVLNVFFIAFNLYGWWKWRKKNG